MAGTAQRRAPTEAGVELDDDRIVWTYTLKFQVPADSKDESEDDILVAPGLPSVNFSTHGDRFALCKSKRIVRLSENRKWWEVDAEFDTRQDNSDNNEQDQPQDPTALELNVSWGSEKIVIYREKDLDDKEFKNSAGEPFEGGLPTELAIPVLTIQRFEDTFSATTILNYENRVNKSKFYGAEPGQALMANIQASRTLGSDSTLWNVTYKVKFNIHDSDGFKVVKKLNKGSYYLDGSGDEIPFMTKPDRANNAPPIPRMGLLDGDGKNTGTTPSYEDFRVKDEAEFDDLQLA